MITLFSSNQVQSLESARSALRKQIEGLARTVSSVGHTDKVLRFEYKIEPIDLLSWLHNQKTKSKVYFSTRGEDQEMAGVGCADEISSSQDYAVVLEKMRDRLSADNPRLQYFGGFSFSDQSIDAKWDVFGASRFIVPQFELMRLNEEYYFSFHIHIQNITEECIQKILIDFNALDFAAETTYRKAPEILHREDLPQKEQWSGMVEAVLQSPIDKTVLARQSKFQFDLKIRPNALIKFLKDLTPRCFHFCLQLDEQTGFLGATPELLFRVQDNQLISEAVAGTASEEDLRNDSKFQLEHKYVVDMLQEQFELLCQTHTYDKDANILKLKEMQHLQTEFSGTLKPEIGAGDILKALHPTPAVGGYPKEESIHQIEKLEPFARGWYAAPIGRVGYDACEFLVAIRSGLIHQGDLYLYAGAGIVKGSTAEDEWNEIEQKISRFMKVFSSAST